MGPSEAVVIVVASLDVAAMCGFALLVRHDDGSEVLRIHGAVAVDAAGDVDSLVGRLAAYRTDVFALEEPWSHPRNPSTGLTLSRLLGRFLQAIEGRGLTAVTIPASMWQPAVLPGVTNRTRSAERKAAAVAFAKERFQVEVGEDAADAIALGCYTARNATRRAA